MRPIIIKGENISGEHLVLSFLKIGVLCIHYKRFVIIMKIDV